MGPIWGPPGADRTQVGPVLAPWTLLSGYRLLCSPIMTQLCRLSSSTKVLICCLIFIVCWHKEVISNQKETSCRPLLRPGFEPGLFRHPLTIIYNVLSSACKQLHFVVIKMKIIPKWNDECLINLTIENKNQCYVLKIDHSYIIDGSHYQFGTFL